mmetsp:Transcript_18056/g.51352  ORF Transcript_18056/g.51352 Transcript_18056/m.51352 type:complete len:214 (+) Transcript_18056:61-702(+)
MPRCIPRASTARASPRSPCSSGGSCMPTCGSRRASASICQRRPCRLQCCRTTRTSTTGPERRRPPLPLLPTSWARSGGAGSSSSAATPCAPPCHAAPRPRWPSAASAEARHHRQYRGGHATCPATPPRHPRARQSSALRATPVPTAARPATRGCRGPPVGRPMRRQRRLARRRCTTPGSTSSACCCPAAASGNSSSTRLGAGRCSRGAKTVSS